MFWFWLFFIFDFASLFYFVTVMKNFRMRSLQQFDSDIRKTFEVLIFIYFSSRFSTSPILLSDIRFSSWSQAFFPLVVFSHQWSSIVISSLELPNVFLYLICHHLFTRQGCRGAMSSRSQRRGKDWRLFFLFPSLYVISHKQYFKNSAFFEKTDYRINIIF